MGMGIKLGYHVSLRLSWRTTMIQVAQRHSRTVSTMPTQLVTTSASTTQVCSRSSKMNDSSTNTLPTMQITAKLVCLSAMASRANRQRRVCVRASMARTTPSEARAQPGKGQAEFLQVSRAMATHRQTSMNSPSQWLSARKGTAMSVGTDRFFLNSFSTLTASSSPPPPRSSRFIQIINQHHFPDKNESMDSGVCVAILAVLAGTVLAAFVAAVVAVAVLLLAVGFGALTALALRTLHWHLLPQSLETLRVDLEVGTVGALAVLAAEQPIAEAVAVKLQALGLPAVALELAGRVGAWRRRVNGDEGVVLEQVLEAAVAGELDGVELSQLDLAPLPLAAQAVQQLLPSLWLVAHQHCLPVLPDLVGHAPRVRGKRQLRHLHKILQPAKHHAHLQNNTRTAHTARRTHTPINSFTHPPLPPSLPSSPCLLVYNSYRMGNNPASREKASSEGQMLVGFENKPLTLCYANSILQVLFHHPVFSHIVRSSKFNEGILLHLRELLEAMEQRKKNESVSTSKLMRFIEKESAIFERERHQDCHEFYIWLMNSINDQIKSKDKPQKGQPRQPTPLEEEFFSKRATVTECQVCHTVTEREEEEVDLSLVLPEPNVSLNYCITNYSKGEKLAGRDKFKCDKCGQLVEAVKATHIKTLPNFLSVHLRRFKYDEYKRGITKLVWQIPFPFKLRVATTYSKPAADSLYKLVGVVVHLGTGENYGHYISYIKIGQKWFVFNDDEISETECYLLESLWGYKGLSKCAYMLFYSI